MKGFCSAIVLKQINYGDASVIISCFTKEQGLKSFIYKGGKKKNKAVLFPLRLVEINYYQHNEDALASVNSIQAAMTLPNLYQNPIKASVIFFISEFLNQLLNKIQYTETNLFEEIKQELIWLNETDELAKYPIFWLIKWIEKLGLTPTVTEKASCFDIESAQFCQSSFSGRHYFSGEEMQKLAYLFMQDRLKILSYPLNKNERNTIFDALVAYCLFHIPEFKQFKSVEILKTVLT